MAIIRWSPFDINSLLESGWEVPTLPGISRLGQGLNLYETEDSVVAEAALPGIPEDNIDVTVDDGIVRVSGSATQKEGGKRRNYMETMSSSYNYAFRLPQGVAEGEEPACTLDNGVLMLTFPKAQKAAPKRIKISRKTREKGGKE